MPYIPIIGLEIHVQLKTKSKMFCPCNNAGENQPINTTICPICLGHPGTLPTANRQAIEWTFKAAIALNCQIQEESKFDRKHYFYPDLPKGYQISQYDKPFGKNGYLNIAGIDNQSKRIRINRLHLEEDAAKLLHQESDKKKYSIVDFNRAGTPLMEIVSEPDLRSPKEAAEFLRELRLIMRALEISDADMEKGHLRCDANISLLLDEFLSELYANLDVNTQKKYDLLSFPVDLKKLSPKTEIKNLNSFKAVERALEYEILRQTKLWEQGQPPKNQSTRGWNDKQQITEPQREKEEAKDYRYFPEPDIPPINLKNQKSKIKNINQKSKITNINLADIRNSLPELPQAKRLRFMKEFDFSYSDSRILTSDKFLADFTEKVLSELQAWIIAQDMADLTQREIWQKNKQRLAKLTGNWLINKLGRLVFEERQDWRHLKITPENFAEFISLIFQGKINSKVGQEILKLMIAGGADPSNILTEKQLGQIDATEDLTLIIDEVIAENQEATDSYQAGKQNAAQFLVGQAMKKTRGQANPAAVVKILKRKLITKIKNQNTKIKM